MSLLPSARRAKALSSPRRLDTNHLEMELVAFYNLSFVEVEVHSKILQ